MIVCLRFPLIFKSKAWRMKCQASDILRLMQSSKGKMCDTKQYTQQRSMWMEYIEMYTVHRQPSDKSPMQYFQSSCLLSCRASTVRYSPNTFTAVTSDKIHIYIHCTECEQTYTVFLFCVMRLLAYTTNFHNYWIHVQGSSRITKVFHVI